MGIGKSLRHYRRSTGLSQRDFASKANVASSTLAGWEAGYSEPRAAQIVTMAQALDVSADVLLGLKESPWLKEEEQ